MGDAVMAFWGAPLRDADHAGNAVRAALEMVAEMHALHPAFRERGWPAITIGVGISSGEMNVGNMGSRFRAAYTVLGDTVNLGSRLEGLTKKYGVDIVVSATTAALVQNLAFREIDRVRVKGKQEPVAIFEPLGPRAGLTEAQQLAAARFAEVLANYRAQAWEEAETMLSELAARDAQALYALYLERIRHFRANPPPADWDGVFTFETK